MDDLIVSRILCTAGATDTIISRFIQEEIDLECLYELKMNHYLELNAPECLYDDVRLVLHDQNVLYECITYAYAIALNQPIPGPVS